jgi:PqqD family protein of HPr-rel-A system
LVTANSVSNQTDLSTYYVASNESEFLWEHGNEESLLFDRRSGQTHLLTATAVEALLYLQKQPHTLPQLADYIADMFELSRNNDLLEQLEELLNHFVDIGLAETSKTK